MIRIIGEITSHISEVPKSPLRMVNVEKDSARVASPLEEEDALEEQSPRW